MVQRNSLIASRLCRIATLFLAAICASPAALAPGWPEKPIRLVVTVPAGGPVDGLARVLGEAVSRQLRQPVIVDNKPGASGAIALGYTMKQPADGYTLVITANAAFTLVPVVRQMPHKPMQDFTFLGQLVFTPNVFAVPASSPARSLKELVALSKSHPGKLNYGMMQGVPQRAVPGGSDPRRGRTSQPEDFGRFVLPSGRAGGHAQGGRRQGV